MTTENKRMQSRTDTHANWVATNPVGLAGELAYDSTYDAVKILDGTNAFNSRRWIDLDPNVLNPKRYGAKGDGSTVDDLAFATLQTDLFANERNDYNAYGDYRLTKSVSVPPGSYLFNGNGKLIGDVITNYSSGLLVDCSGMDATTFVFNPSAPSGYLCFDNDRLYHITFMNCSFFVTGTNAATSTMFKSVSNGHAQSYTFVNCLFAGTPKYGLALSGSNNNSEMKFTNCKFLTAHGSGNAFLFSPSVGAGGSDQYVDYQFTDCDIEYVSGDFIQMATGGCINISGGSLIHQGDGSQTTSTQQRFVSMLGASHSAGCDSVSISNCRVEHRHNNSQLVYSERARGNIVIDNVNAETDAWLLSTPSSVKQIEVVGSNGNYPNVSVKNSMLMGQQVIHFGSASYQARPKMKYELDEFVDPVTGSTRAVDYFTFPADGGTTNTAGAPLVRVEDCRSTNMTDSSESFDTNLNWRTAINTPIKSKMKFFHGASTGPATGAQMKVPLNSVITGFVARKKTGGTSTLTTVTYTLVNGDGTTIATLAPGVTWNTAWKTNAGQLASFCDTNNQRTLTVNFANVTETNADLQIGVLYDG